MNSIPTPIDYVRRGFALIPIPRGTKGPRERGWQTEAKAIRSESDAAKLVSPNIGLAHRWSNTCAIDVDNYLDALEWFDSTGISLRDLFHASDAVEIKSGRPNRGKLIYRLPSEIEWLPTIQPAGSGVEFRCSNRDGTATLQDVLPPSIHPETKVPYKWAGSGNWRNLPVLPGSILNLWKDLTKQPASRETRERSLSIPATIPKGSRNTTLTSFAGSMRRRGMTQESIAAALLVENKQQCNPPLTDVEVRAIAKSASRYPADDHLNVEPNIRFPSRLDLALLSQIEPTPPPFILQGWLPARAVTLMSSHGAGGKSQIALHLAISLAAGLQWCGVSPARRMRILLMSCEDGQAALHWRLSRLCITLNVEMDDLADWLFIDDATDADCLLFQGGTAGQISRFTDAFYRLEQTMRSESIDILIIDNASDVFGGNEISRPEVREFLSALGRLSRIPECGAVLILGHVNREASRTTGAGAIGQQYSGSTAWHNSVRSRLELTTDRQAEYTGNESTSSVNEDLPRTLTVVKSNYGPAGTSSSWCWSTKHQVLLPNQPPSLHQQTVRRELDRQGLLRAVHYCTDTLKLDVRDVAGGPTNLRSVLARSTHFPAVYRNRPVTALQLALSQLVSDGFLAMVKVMTAGRRSTGAYRVTEAGTDWLQSLEQPLDLRSHAHTLIFEDCETAHGPEGE